MFDGHKIIYEWDQIPYLYNLVCHKHMVFDSLIGCWDIVLNKGYPKYLNTTVKESARQPTTSGCQTTHLWANLSQGERE